jgi:hypothetical protein
MKGTCIGRVTLCLVFSYVAVARANAEELQLTLRSDRDHYRVGEDIKFKIIYKNTSNHPIWLLPQTESYPVDALSIKKFGDSRRPQKIRLGEQSVAWDGLAEQAVRVKPGAEIQRLLQAEVRSNLPSIYEETSEGIFLVLPGSAVRLLGTGDYEVRAVFHSSPNHPVNRYLPSGAHLWRGDVTSNPISITISE